MLLGWSILVALAGALILPFAWAAAAFYRWLLLNLRLSDGTTFSFAGRGFDVWGYFVLAALIGGFTPQVAMVYFDGWDPHDSHIHATGLDINLLKPLLVWDIVSVKHLGRSKVSFRVNLAAPVTVPLGAAMAVFVVGWVVRNIGSTRGKPFTFTFTGTWPAYLGYSLLLQVSVATIVGWAWVAAAMFCWFCRNLQVEDEEVIFLGKGHEILWRGLAGGLACLLLIPIPWILGWWYRWLFSCVVVRTTALEPDTTGQPWPGPTRPCPSS
jgi:hypothetical protein